MTQREKKIFIVEVHGVARELYRIASYTEDEAADLWVDKQPFLTEVGPVEVYSISEEVA